ncbi:hypothetical protein Lfu02_12910 [Longispora fulva]|uniref:Tyrosinase n=1 Tax=Longispora fulva TaxID=619741 RepID=A0A8J7GKX2_9ACTN|nr:tyrosinase family protein [Longispora fulva]MBG6134849.1 tyrosinase [Longispora fulva]GIG56919.1 hypothetical protein Lfu02_12910 [Longispora fulva]
MPHTFVRRDVWDLQAEGGTWNDTLSWYSIAVDAMTLRSAKDVLDPTGWTYQAAMHGTKTPNPKPGVLWNRCQHGSWFFYPWHRMYLYYFERIVRSVIVRDHRGPADWALPYWNYLSGGPHAALPPAFREPSRDLGPNPLYRELRNTTKGVDVNAGDPITGVDVPGQPSVVSYERSFSYRNFWSDNWVGPSFGGTQLKPAQFGGNPGQLEIYPHGVVHDAVGGEHGLMGNVRTAASDPIFWLHHGNIDRMWELWLRRGEGRANPDHKDWRAQKFEFYDEDGNRQTMTAADVLDTARQLGYRYDNLHEVAPTADAGGPRARRSPTPGRPRPEPELLAASERGTTLTGTGVTVGIALDPAARDTMAAAGAPRGAGDAQEGEDRFALALEGVSVDRQVGEVYQVYMRPSADAADEYFVANLSFFGAQPHVDNDEDDAAHPGGDLSMSFDITDIVRRLTADGRWDRSRVTVDLRPMGTSGIADAARPGHPPAVIRRFGIYRY